jgi:hypothetical protein
MMSFFIGLDLSQKCDYTASNRPGLEATLSELFTSGSGQVHNELQGSSTCSHLFAPSL